jgi:hypothetical protein
MLEVVGPCGVAIRGRNTMTDNEAAAEPSSPKWRDMMKRRQGAGGKPEAQPRSRRRRILRATAWLLLVLVGAATAVRLFLPAAIEDYVNRTLDRDPIFAGRIGEIRIHLWRGAYSIYDVNISKTTGNVPVPLFSAKRVDFSMEWNAIWHRRLVGRVLMEDPELNFVDAETGGDAQTGEGGPWLEIIRDLFPFTINSAVIENGSVHFRAYHKKRPVDIYLTQLNATIDNLRNTTDETAPMAATVKAAAMAMDQSKVEIQMTLDPFSYRPTFHLASRLLGLDVTKLNDLALAYGRFDFKRGWLDLVVEADSNEGRISGYVKPLFRNLKVFDLREDIQQDNGLQFFWRALVGLVTETIKNQPRDQFGTLIPFTGDASGSTTADIFATVGNLLRNAFIRAYLPNLENSQAVTQSLQFEPPRFDDLLSPTDSF